AGRSPTFIGPDLSVNNTVLDKTLFGSSVTVITNQIQPGLLQRNPVAPTSDSGRINVSNSTISIDQGAVIFDSPIRSSKIILPRSTIAAAAYGSSLALGPAPTHSPFDDFTEFLNDAVGFGALNPSLIVVRAPTGSPGAGLLNSIASFAPGGEGVRFPPTS